MKIKKKNRTEYLEFAWPEAKRDTSDMQIK
jgi:hypothetical protein